MKKLLTALLLTMTLTAHAKKAPKIYITGEVDGSIVIQADELRALSQKHKVVKLIINSPGGSVYAGLQFINAMIAAQKKGVKIKCYVGGMAASMAFQFFVHCDERYATPYAMLLWHAPRTTAYGVTESDAAYITERLGAIEDIMLPKLISTVGMDKDLFMYHYHKETLWLALELEEYVPNFMTIIVDIPGAAKIWSPDDAKKAFKKLQRRK